MVEDARTNDWFSGGHENAERECPNLLWSCFSSDQSATLGADSHSMTWGSVPRYQKRSIACFSTSSSNWVCSTVLFEKYVITPATRKQLKRHLTEFEMTGMPGAMYRVRNVCVAAEANPQRWFRERLCCENIILTHPAGYPLKPLARCNVGKVLFE